MKSEIDCILSELEQTVLELELEFLGVVTHAPKIIATLESGFERIKSLISDFQFDKREDEIHFFRVQKPQLFSKLIYYQKIYHIELKRPISGYLSQRNYLERELEQLNVFSDKNADFIQYYRSGKTLMDEYYFLRGRREIELNLESFYFERDPKFSTHFDFKVARLLANDMLAAHLNNQLSKLKYQEENNFPTDIEIPSAQWTDKKTALTEIIYGIYEEKSINSGNIEIKALATILGRIFNVDLSDIYHIYLEIRSRKTNRTEFLNRLIKALNKRMNEADSK